MFNFSGKRPTTLGVREGRLGKGPAKPNWVSSNPDADSAHRIAPLQSGNSRSQARAKLLDILRAQPNVTVVEQRDDYVYAEFKTPLMGFVDDVEFYLPADNGAIEVRSASRLGYSDVGVNRKRVEMLRAALG